MRSSPSGKVSTPGRADSENPGHLVRTRLWVLRPPGRPFLHAVAASASHNVWARPPWSPAVLAPFVLSSSRGTHNGYVEIPALADCSVIAYFLGSLSEPSDLRTFYYFFFSLNLKKLPLLLALSLGFIHSVCEWKRFLLSCWCTHFLMCLLGPSHAGPESQSPGLCLQSRLPSEPSGLLSHISQPLPQGGWKQDICLRPGYLPLDFLWKNKVVCWSISPPPLLPLKAPMPATPFLPRRHLPTLQGQALLSPPLGKLPSSALPHLWVYSKDGYITCVSPTTTQQNHSAAFSGLFPMSPG